VIATVWIIEQIFLAVGAVGVALVAAPVWRNALVGMFIAFQGLAGVVGGVLVLAGSDIALRFSTALPIAMADTIVPDFPLANKSFNQSYAGNDL